MNDQQVEKDQLLELIAGKYKEILKREGDHYKLGEYYRQQARWYGDLQTTLSFVVAVSSGAAVIALPAWIPFLSSLGLSALNEYLRVNNFGALSTLHSHVGLLYSGILDFLDEQKLLNLEGDHHVYVEQGEAKKILDFEDYRVYLVGEIDKRIKDAEIVDYPSH